MRLVVLSYHRVAPEAPASPEDLTITPAYSGLEGANAAGADAWELKRTTIAPAHGLREFRSQLRLGWNPAAGPRRLLQRWRRPGAAIIRSGTTLQAQ